MPFRTTRWSLIDVTRGEKSPEKTKALEILTRLYRRPAYEHIRARGYSREDADDLVQEFFVYWLEKELFGRADRARGSFRSYFRKVLDNYLAKSWRRAHAKRRYPAGGFVADDLERVPGADSPEDVFWRTFASDLIHQVLLDVLDGMEERGMTGHVQAFRIWFVAPVLDGAERPSQRALAATLEVTPKQVSNMLTTVKRAYQAGIERVVREYAIDEDDVAEELKALMGYADFDADG